MNFGEKISQLRQSRKMTQRQGAELMGMSLTSFRKLEYTAENPRLSTIVRVMKAFKVGMEELFPQYTGKAAELDGMSKSLLEEFDRLTPEQKIRLLQFIKTV